MQSGQQISKFGSVTLTPSRVSFCPLYHSLSLTCHLAPTLFKLCIEKAAIPRRYGGAWLEYMVEDLVDDPAMIGTSPRGSIIHYPTGLLFPLPTEIPPKRHCFFAYLHNMILNTSYTLIVIPSSLDNSDTPVKLDLYIKRLCLRTDHLGLKLLLPLYERPSRSSVAIG